LITRTRPGRFRILEYTGLGANVWLIVQGARWNKHLPGIAHLPWQRPTTLGAKSAGKALCPWKLVGFYLGGVSRPGQSSITDEYVARMASTRRFSAARAVTMVKTGGLPGHYKFKRAT